MKPLTPPRLLVLSIPVFVTVYILLVGPLAFYYESLGTLLLSPTIYTRLLPDPMAYTLRQIFLDHPISIFVACAIPVAMLITAALAGLLALRRESVCLSLVSIFLTASVFVTYHFLQPLGFSVVR
ncbi:MAG: hypothetical protein ACK5NG_10330 [Chthoniobacterales bacterium]